MKTESFGRGARSAERKENHTIWRETFDNNENGKDSDIDNEDFL